MTLKALSEVALKSRKNHHISFSDDVHKSYSSSRVCNVLFKTGLKFVPGIGNSGSAPPPPKVDFTANLDHDFNIYRHVSFKN